MCNIKFVRWGYLDAVLQLKQHVISRKTLADALKINVLNIKTSTSWGLHLARRIWKNLLRRTVVPTDNRTRAVRLCLFCDRRNGGNTRQAKHFFLTTVKFPNFSRFYKVDGCPEGSMHDKFTKHDSSIDQYKQF